MTAAAVRRTAFTPPSPPQFKPQALLTLGSFPITKRQILPSKACWLLHKSFFLFFLFQNKQMAEVLDIPRRKLIILLKVEIVLVS